MTDSRYPYTHSCDFIRGLGPVGSGGVVLSRSDASQIRQGIADALGLDDYDLADRFLQQNEDPAFLKQQADLLLYALGMLS